MERKIGEIFEYQGKKLKVIEGENKCDKCYFYKDNYCTRIDRIAGQCLTSKRTDNKSVNFIEVTEEQPQELNLCKILKHCPKETELYSPMYGKVYFNCVFNSGDDSIIYCYKTRLREGCTRSTNSQCTDIVAFYNNGTTGNPDFNITSECMLFPSATQRDWSKFTTPWIKEERLPKTWEDFIEIMNLKYPSAGCFVEEIPKGLIDSYPTLNQIIAVLKLKKLRDYYNNNWHCDWTNEYEENAVITRSHGKLIVRADWAITTFLTFKSIEIAKEFLTNFRELIEQAGDLI